MTQKIKYKEGDTVTATVTPLGGNDGPKPFEIKGEVYTDSFVLMVGAFRLTEPNVTVTDCQPGPEPEPVHPGFYDVHPNENPGATWSGVIDINGDFRGVEDGFYRAADKGHYKVSTSLVVIYPAAVNKNELALLIDDSRHEGMWAQVAKVLDYFGIEEYPN